MYERKKLPERFRRGQAAATAEMHAAGLSRHTVARLDGTDLSRIRRGMYVVGTDEQSWSVRASAAIKSCGAHSYLFGPSALAAYGVTEYAALPVHVLVDPRRRILPPEWVSLHRKQVADRRLVDSLDPPRVGFDDSVIDTAEILDRGGAVATVCRVIQERRTTAPRLKDVIDRRPRVRHRALLLDVLEDAARGVHSALEHRYLVDVERAHALPPGTRQFTVPETGCVVDIAYENERILIELDGAAYHDPEEDRQRDNLHAAHGYRTIRITWLDIITDPCRVARLIWALAACRHCA